MRAVNELRSLIKRYSITVVHGHPFASIVPAFVASQCERLPFVVTLHGPSSINHGYGDTFDLMLKEVLESSQVVSVSKEVSKLANEKFGVESVILPNSVSKTNGEVGVILKYTTQIRWLVASRLDRMKIKGIKKFITLINDEGLGNIDIAGDGDARYSLEQFCASNNYSNVKFLGMIKDVTKIIPKYDWCAGMGRFALESMEAGKPFILVGYDDIVRVMNNIDSVNIAAEVNFSGREMTRQSLVDIRESIASISKTTILNIQREIHENHSEFSVWGSYIKIITCLKYINKPSRLLNTYHYEMKKLSV